jgi:hypothetical protein
MRIGVVLLLVENPRLGRAPRYREVREVALEVESVGFDSMRGIPAMSQTSRPSGCERTQWSQHVEPSVLI